MDNHFQIIWQAVKDKIPLQLQPGFVKYTAQQIKFDLVQNHPLVLDKFKVNAKDRIYQFLEKNLLGIDCIRMMYLCRSLRTRNGNQ